MRALPLVCVRWVTPRVARLNPHIDMRSSACARRRRIARWDRRPDACRRCRRPCGRCSAAVILHSPYGDPSFPPNPTTYLPVRTLIRAESTMIPRVPTMIQAVLASSAGPGTSSIGTRPSSASVPRVLQEASGKRPKGLLGVGRGKQRGSRGRSRAAFRASIRGHGSC